jgi:hypothetical protein
LWHHPVVKKPYQLHAIPKWVLIFTRSRRGDARIVYSSSGHKLKLWHHPVVKKLYPYHAIPTLVSIFTRSRRDDARIVFSTKGSNLIFTLNPVNPGSKPKAACEGKGSSVLLFA